MKPFLDYGWQPQIMAVEGRQKAILRGQDRGLRRRRRSGGGEESRRRREPVAGAAQGARRLSGAVAGGRAGAREPDRRGAAQPGEPRLRQRERAAGRPQGRAASGRHGRRSSTRSSRRRGSSSQERYAQVDPAAREDPRGRSVQPRRRAAPGDGALVARPGRAGARRRSSGPPRSRRGRRTSGPTSRCTTRAARTGSRPCRCSSSIVAETPERLPALEALAVVRERQGRIAEAIALRQKIATRCARRRAAELVRLGQLAMQAQQTTLAIESFERRASAGGRRRSRTTSSSACSTWPRAGSPTRATRSIASRRHIRTIRWRSSSARRSACC